MAENPANDAKASSSQALYYRALANYELANYRRRGDRPITLTTSPLYASSLSRPDYFCASAASTRSRPDRRRHGQEAARSHRRARQ